MEEGDVGAVHDGARGSQREGERKGPPFTPSTATPPRFTLVKCLIERQSHPTEPSTARLSQGPNPQTRLLRPRIMVFSALPATSWQGPRRVGLNGNTGHIKTSQSCLHPLSPQMDGKRQREPRPRERERERES